MTSLLLRNLFFTLLQPGVVVGVIPYFLIRHRFTHETLLSVQWHHIPGAMLFIAGTVLLVHCVLRFATEGRGTLSPIDPTRALVVRGMYRYSRNPMYLGVLCMLTGEAIFFQSFVLLLYTILIFLTFHVFIVLHEEPRLRRVFGEQYDRYCKTVRRWI